MSDAVRYPLVLGIISLFKRPVETKSFVTLLSKIKSLKDTPLAKADKSTTEKQLNLLIDERKPH